MRKQLSRDEKVLILKRTNNRCAHCGKTLTYRSATTEHLYPVSKGGSNCEYNITMLCEKCNEEKSNFTIADIRTYYRFILPEHIDNYLRQYDLETRTNGRDTFALLDENQFYYIPNKAYDMLCEMAYKGRKNKQIIKIANTLLKEATFEKAYFAEIKHVSDGLGIKAEEYNIEPYTLYNDICDGKAEAYIVRTKNFDIMGMIVLDIVNFSVDDADDPEFKEIIRKTKWEIKYILRTSLLMPQYSDLGKYLLRFIDLNFISRNYMELANFDELSKGLTGGESFTGVRKIRVPGLNYEIMYFTLESTEDMIALELENMQIPENIDINKVVRYITNRTSELSKSEIEDCSKLINKTNLYFQLHPKVITKVVKTVESTVDGKSDIVSLSLY